VLADTDTDVDPDDVDGDGDDLRVVDLDEDVDDRGSARETVEAVVDAAIGSSASADPDEDDPTDGGTYTVWEVAGILPLSVTLPSGTGYTLRTYNGEDDEPLFLGADLTVDLFRTADGLAAYVRSGEEHDLSDMVTWSDLAEADDLAVEPDPEEVYDLRSPSEDAVELALELADYCDLEGVTGTLTRRRTGDIPFDTWKSAIDELETCVRWHD
jgi:hypothetical protein